MLSAGTPIAPLAVTLDGQRLVGSAHLPAGAQHAVLMLHGFTGNRIEFTYFLSCYRAFWRRAASPYFALIFSVAAKARVNLPTLIVHGEADLAVPVVVGEQVAACLPNAIFEAWPEVDHAFSRLRHRQQLGERLADFVLSV